MTYHSRIAAATMLANIATFIWQYRQLLEALAGPEGAQQMALHYGRFYLKYLGLVIAANVAVVILFNILTAISGKGEVPEITDERDRSIDLMASRNAAVVFYLSFFAGAVLMAFFAHGVQSLLTVMAFSMLGVGLVLYASYIFYYQRGY